MIPLKVQMVIMSHLSDIQESARFMENPEKNIDRADFCKFLLMKYSDTTTEIDADAEYKAYQDMKTAPRYEVLHFDTKASIGQINMLQRNKALNEGLISFIGKKQYTVLEENIKPLKKLIGL